MTHAVDNEVVDAAVRLVLNTALPGEAWTRETIEARVAAVLTMMQGVYGSDRLPDGTEVVRQIEARVNVWQPEGVSLVDPSGHEEWLTEARTTTKWQFWDRYRQYLEDVELLPRAVVRRLGDSTDATLGKLESPDRPGEWDRRGMVVGQVQSGKTANYTALICKAADAGYRLILVLAGIHNSLRSQTQLRLDEGFLGADSQFLQRTDQDANHYRIGVGALTGFPRLDAGSLTTSAENGDFRDAKAKSLALPIGNYPVVLVVKKHAGILTNIHDWVTTVHGTPDGAGNQVVRDLPLLVIDDEADNASIDTSRVTREETDPSAVNRAIRRILRAFTRSAYVGYTATPYANLYVRAYGRHSTYGEDVFPRSFIDVLRPPTNYMGPERVFGLDDDVVPLPIHRAVRDHTQWMPDKHDKYWVPPADLPASLIKAVQTFVLTCAARRVRGDKTKHNSMLVHVTRFQDVQGRVAKQLGEQLSIMRDRLRYGDGDRSTKLVDELEKLWGEDFAPTSGRFPDPESLTLSWDDVHNELLSAISKIELRVMNGKAKDALEYYERRREGLSVLAVGGDKLSRGLTLEGLSVSYYLRATKMYDTLLQMGRWFGYRPRYEDLCRLYTTPDLYDWYREITIASDQLRAELEEMAAQRATPEQYGLRVRTSAAGLSITAANKMRRAQRIKLSFSGRIPESIAFDIRPTSLQANRQALEDLCTRLDASGDCRPNQYNRLLWWGVPGTDVLRFLDAYRGDVKSLQSRPDLIARYVRQCHQMGELHHWDVMLVDNQSKRNNWEMINGHPIGLTLRDLLTEVGSEDVDKRIAEIESEQRYVIRRVLSPADEYQNLDSGQYDAALSATIQRWKTSPPRPRRNRQGELKVPTEPKVPAGPELRLQRRDDQPLLILYVLENSKYAAVVEQPMIGFAISFPFSENNVEAEYAVNEVWQKLQLADIDLDVEDVDG